MLLNCVEYTALLKRSASNIKSGHYPKELMAQLGSDLYPG
jgi:hypothetical protein